MPTGLDIFADPEAPGARAAPRSDQVPAAGPLTTAADHAQALAARPLGAGFLTAQERREIGEARALVRRFYGW